MVGAFAILGDGPSAETAEAAKEYYDDLNSIAMHALIIGAATGVVWFAGALHRVVGSVLSLACMVAGAAVLLVTNALLMGTAESQELDQFTFDPSLLEAFDNTAYFALASAHTMLGLGIIAAGSWALRNGSLPKWLAWSSLVVGAFALASSGFFPMFLVWVWMLVTGLLLVLRAPAEPALPVTATTRRETVPA
jgi:hypothetical protein